jgi:predicted kinase
MDWDHIAEGNAPCLDGSTGEAVLDALVGCPQTAVHHGEGDVAAHTRLVFDAVEPALAQAGLSGRDAQRVRLAALLHDVGKPQVTVETAPCEWSSPRHAEAGAQLATSLFDQDVQLRARSLADRALVAALVRAHMWVWHPENVSFGALVRTAHLAPLDQLAVLFQADAEGRVAADRDRLVEQVAWAKELLFDQVSGVLSDPYTFLPPSVDPRKLDSRLRRSVLRAVVEGRVTSEGAALAHLAAGERRPSKAHIVWMSGLPGSGKSTFAGLLQSSLDAEVLTVSGARRRDRDASRGANRRRLEELVRSGATVVVDATHLTRDSRDRLCSLADRYDARLDAVVVDTPSSVCISRQQHRDSGQSVPAATIESMLASWRWPTPDEYDTLTVVDPSGAWAYTPSSRDALLESGRVPSSAFLSRRAGR